MPAHRYDFNPGAARDFRQLDPTMQRRIVAAPDRLVEEPPRGDVKKLQGRQDGWHLRVGRWRVRFARERDTGDLLVLSIEPRGRAYRD